MFWAPDPNSKTGVKESQKAILKIDARRHKTEPMYDLNMF